MFLYDTPFTAYISASIRAQHAVRADDDDAEYVTSLHIFIYDTERIRT